MGELVRVETDEAIATIRLSRPPMNALNAQVQEEIAAAADEVSADPAVRAVVLYGGPKVFAAGAGHQGDVGPQLRPRWRRTRSGSRPASPRSRRYPSRWSPRSPVTRSAAAWNLRCARTSGWRPGRPGGPAGDPARRHPRRGRHAAAAPAGRPGPGQGHHLHRPVRRRGGGAGHWPGQPGRAGRRGLRGGARTGGPVAAGPALALRAAKQAVDAGLEADLDTGLEIERLQFAGLFATEDQQDGMRSFIENGPGRHLHRSVTGLRASAESEPPRPRMLSRHAHLYPDRPGRFTRSPLTATP